jgi:hypothetical protein
MPDNHVVVRDFIYLDTDKLYSLYSQLFEGVVDRIVESSESGKATTDSQKAGPLKGKSIDIRVAEVSIRTENKILYDHMYHRLEQRMGASIVSGAELNPASLREVLDKSFFVKATGSAEIEDSQRMEALLSKYNEVGAAIAYAFVSTQTGDGVAKKQAEIQQIPDRNQRKRAEAELRNLLSESRTKEVAAAMGLTQDEKLLSNLRLFTSLFHPNAFEVTIVPAGVANPVGFRGVLDKQWLRITPQHMNDLYGGYVEANWTMVGQVTHLPGEALPEPQSTPESPVDQAGVTKSPPSMRDPSRAMFRASRTLERIFLESHERPEVIVSPIALYRAMEVPVSPVSDHL